MSDSLSGRDRENIPYETSTYKTQTLVLSAMQFRIIRRHLTPQQKQ